VSGVYRMVCHGQTARFSLPLVRGAVGTVLSVQRCASYDQGMPLPSVGSSPACGQLPSMWQFPRPQAGRSPKLVEPPNSPRPHPRLGPDGRKLGMRKRRRRESHNSCAGASIPDCPRYGPAKRIRGSTGRPGRKIDTHRTTVHRRGPQLPSALSPHGYDPGAGDTSRALLW